METTERLHIVWIKIRSGGFSKSKLKEILIQQRALMENKTKKGSQIPSMFPSSWGQRRNVHLFFSPKRTVKYPMSTVSLTFQGGPGHLLVHNSGTQHFLKHNVFTGVVKLITTPSSVVRSDFGAIKNANRCLSTLAPYLSNCESCIFKNHLSVVLIISVCRGIRRRVEANCSSQPRDPNESAWYADS